MKANLEASVIAVLVQKGVFLALPLTKALGIDRFSLFPSYADAKTTRPLVFRLPIRKHGRRPIRKHGERPAASPETR